MLLKVIKETECLKIKVKEKYKEIKVMKYNE